ncbi:MAG: hypothetical protein KY462_08970 [Actinobacteria bacterium]|nr:hypothetical protein [Actinomycetota bacterium]
MERVAFLIEETGQRIGCLLNPSTVVVSRAAGVRPRSTAAGQLTGSTLMDDPLLFTGGGRTELDLDLLFDITISERTAELYQDVRELTRPLMMLAENTARQQGVRRPPLVRFVWGKSWNVPGVVAAAAERFDDFTAEGVPRRSWLKLKLLRVAEESEEMFREFPEPPQPPSAIDLDAEPVGVVRAIGDGDDAGGYAGTRPDLVAAQALDNPLSWRLLAVYNDLDDPFGIEAGTALRIPPTRPRRSTR